jgi:hypothetical protein
MTILVMHIMLFAVPQTIQTARLVAGNFIEIMNDSFQLDDSYIVQDQDENRYFVFNLDPAGFIALAADDVITPIIAYSYNQRLENELLTENLLHMMLKTDMELRQNYYSENPTVAYENQQLWQSLMNGNYRDQLRFQQWPAPGSTLTDGWVETQWNQSGVYSQMCPLDNSGARSVVGCVATAMAMIMDYHEYIGNPVFTDADDYSSGWWNPMYIDDDWEERDFPPFPELNDYLQDVAAHYAAGITLTEDDKAALNFACGVSVEMGYSSTGSGAWTEDVASALVNKFDYDSAQYIENNGYAFYNVLIENIQSMQPTELTIYQPDYEGGHAIICDGYNTNDFYHLNFGWGTSNSNCWYTLPTGMPSGYTIITGSVVNIEGGDVPVAVQGDVNVSGASPEGACITFDGPRFYECIVEDTAGGFEIPAVASGIYTITAILENRAYYQCQEDVLIDENNHFVQIDLGEFANFTGNVIVPISPENTTITFYRDEELAYMGTSDASGNYSIPEVLPGEYFVTASLAGNYFTSKMVEVTLEDQTEDFELEEYAGNIALAQSGPVSEIWNLIPNYTISCAIKITPNELSDLGNDVISGVRFKAPISDNEGDLFAQIWNGDNLLSETEISAFTAGEWLDIDLNSFLPVESDQEYLVGYKIYSETGAMAYRDAGPRISGKGAFFRNGAWVELASNNDFNFCIEAKIITKECGSVSGNVVLNGGNGNILDLVVKAGKYVVHPDADGEYMISMKEGNYGLSAELTDYTPDNLNGVTVITDQITENQNFTLVYGVGADDNPVVLKSGIIGNYPNPFNPTTTIRFSVAQSPSTVKIVVYNLKGQKVKTLIDTELPAGEHTIVWNGKDDQDKAVSSGMYFVDMDSNGRFTSVKKVILLK